MLTEECAPAPPPRENDAAVVHERFNLHASVHLVAADDLGRERLCRYLTRPAFSPAGLRVRHDGTGGSLGASGCDRAAATLPFAASPWSLGATPAVPNDALGRRPR